jgi:hypothetical protein
MINSMFTPLILKCLLFVLLASNILGMVKQSFKIIVNFYAFQTKSVEKVGNLEDSSLVGNRGKYSVHIISWEDNSLLFK